MDLRTRLKRLEKLDERFSVEVDCICFPSDEPPQLQLKTEIESARSVLCPLHGARFANVAPTIWRAIELPDHLTLDKLYGHSSQYLKAMKASFPPDRWPATEVTESDGTVRFVLKDGMEIHRIGPPTPVYGYYSRKLVGHIGRGRRFIPLAPSPAAKAAKSDITSSFAPESS